MNGWDRAVELLPNAWGQALDRFSSGKPEEIRLRVGRTPTILFADGERTFLQETVTEETLRRVLEKATSASVHTAAPALSEGYISYRGVRVGVCGTAIIREHRFEGYRCVSSLALRIPRECRGLCRRELDVLTREGFQNTLIIGRPGDGKTTVLRELIRAMSEMGYRIGVSDERNELAACDGARAQFDLGSRSDVMTGLPKAEGAMMLLRGMNPQIIAMDEISRQRDLEAMRQIFGCGVGLLASAHGSCLSELRRREGYRRLLREGVFSWLLTVGKTGEERHYTLERIEA